MGSAPAGVEITYGSDGENLDGDGLPLTETPGVKEDALQYQVTAQLQGGGDIRCSVAVDGRTKTGRARGDYNICSAQLNSDFLGGFGQAVREAAFRPGRRRGPRLRGGFRRRSVRAPPALRGYRICIPEMLRAMTSRWISLVPSKIV